jgi:hypothetical protein
MLMMMDFNTSMQIVQQSALALFQAEPLYFGIH